MQAFPRYCRVCGLRFTPTRRDALVCTDACEKRRQRGDDLAYLKDFSADPVRTAARRSLHDIDEATIKAMGYLDAARRDRQQRRRPLYLRANPPPPKVRSPNAPRGGGFIEGS